MLLLLPIPILLAVSLAFSVATNVSKKLYNRAAPSNKQSIWFFNTMMSLACLIFIVIFSIDPTAADPFAKLIDFSWASVGLGVLFGALVLVQTYTYMWALDIGPFSYTSVIVSLSTLIAALSGLFYGESIDGFQIFGMGIMVLCVIFSTDRTKSDKKSSLKWLVIALISCVTNGGVGAMQKVHQSSPYKAQNTVFLVAAFIFMTACACAMWLVERKKAGEGVFRPTKKQTFYACLSGAVLAVPHVANLFLAGAMPSAVFFPIINTGSLILTLVAATVLFREKLSKLQWVGIVLGLISSLFVSGTVTAWIG